MAKIPAGVGPRFPQVVVLVGATGDLSRRKLIPGLMHLARAGFIPGCRIIGVSLDAFDAESFRNFARESLNEFSARKVSDDDWNSFATSLDYVPLSAGPTALAEAVTRAEASIGAESRRLHYLSVPPNAALSAVRMLGDAGLVQNSRIIMEKPFGTDLASAVSSTPDCTKCLPRNRYSASITSLARKPRRTSSPFASPTDCSSPSGIAISSTTCRSTFPRRWASTSARRFTKSPRARIATWSSRTCSRSSGSWPWSRPPTSPKPISEEKNKVFRSMLPIQPADVVRGQYIGYRSEPGVPESDTENFIALKCSIDNWRWAGVPFYLRTGKRLAEGQRIISIAFREPPKSMFPAGSGVGSHGPDHLTFNLADAAKTSLSFYGKRPVPACGSTNTACSSR